MSWQIEIVQWEPWQKGYLETGERKIVAVVSKRAMVSSRHQTHRIYPIINADTRKDTLISRIDQRRISILPASRSTKRTIDEASVEDPEYRLFHAEDKG